jgi:hypothetical protein
MQCGTPRGAACATMQLLARSVRCGATVARETAAAGSHSGSSCIGAHAAQRGRARLQRLSSHCEASRRIARLQLRSTNGMRSSRHSVLAPALACVRGQAFHRWSLLDSAVRGMCSLNTAVVGMGRSLRWRRWSLMGYVLHAQTALVRTSCARIVREALRDTAQQRVVTNELRRWVVRIAGSSAGVCAAATANATRANCEAAVAARPTDGDVADASAGGLA